MKNLQKFAITNGGFSANGNFSGYGPASTERIHIFGKQMESIGYKPGDKVEFPLFAVAVEKSYEARTVDADGKPLETPGKAITNRLTATAVFKTKAEMISALSVTMLLDAEIKASVKEDMKKLQLSDADVAALLENAI